MAYTYREAIKTAYKYLQIDESKVKVIENTNGRGIVYEFDGVETVIFIYPISCKQNNKQNFFDTRDSGAKERGITWNYAKDNDLRYFCFGFNEEQERYHDYVLSLESDENAISNISFRKSASTDSTGTQVNIPNDFIPSKKFERIKTPKGFYIAAIRYDFISEYIALFDNRPYFSSFEDEIEVSEITPEWFKEKALEFPTLDQEAEEFRQTFIGKFSPDKLKNLADMELLETIFLNANNKTNLCYTLEFDTDSRFIFGSIKSGTAYKYGLHYSQKNGSWATGTGRNPQLLSEEEAIELGTKIRDNLVAGVEVLEELKDVQFIDDYEELYSRLFQVTDGFINRVWFLKYYAILFPTIFPPNYSANAQNTIIEKLALNKSDNTVIRMGIIRDYVDKCELSGVVFSRIFWKYCNNKDDDTEINEDEEIKEEENTMLNCLEKERNPRTVKIHPLNSIIYGAPGTGKTYSTSEYAQAIIEGVSLETFRANNPDRKEVMKKYNELVRAGQIVFTTFHQSYGYEEFIQGLRPDTTSDKMNFKTVDGVFKKIADRALNDDENNYVIIIDEINRANISKVFGELITLIEDDKRWGELNQTSATLQSGDPFAVPNNLYIVGTMNSADKSISLIDAALRRRFEFIEQKPDASLITDPTMRSILIKLNDMLADQLDSADLLIGHSYFMNKTVDDLPKVLNNSIIPLLYEYFYDNKKKVMGVLNNAVEQVDYVIEDDKLGRIYVERQTRN